jgi:type II secretory pathway component PulJ
VIHAVLLKLRDERGFKLIELLITLVMMSALFVVFSQLFTATVKHSHEVQEETTLQTEVRGVVDQLAEDLRSATNGDTTTVPLESMGASSIQFLSPDRVSPYHMRRIAYRLNGHKLERAVTMSTNTGAPPWTGLAWTTPPSTAWVSKLTSVQNTNLFTYLDANGTATTTAANVRSVTINLSLSTSTSQGRQFNYSTSATLRSTQ